MVPLQVDLLFIAVQKNYDGSLVHILTPRLDFNFKAVHNSSSRLASPQQKYTAAKPNYH
jgi:hypothetical protein